MLALTLLASGSVQHGSVFDSTQGSVFFVKGTTSTSTSTTPSPSPSILPLSSSFLLTSAGSWTVNVQHLSQHFLGSPFSVVVAAAKSSPAHCVVSHRNASTVASGVPWSLTIDTYDEFGNPTNDEADSFEAYLDGSGGRSKSFPLRRITPPSISPAQFLFTHTFSDSGPIILHVVHSPTDQPVFNSPFGLRVGISLSQRTALATRTAGIIAGIVLAAVTLVILSLCVGRLHLQKTRRVAVLYSRNKELSAMAKTKDEELDGARKSIFKQAGEMKDFKQMHEAELHKLHEQIRKKKHTDEERRVMKEAMEGGSQEKNGELRGVLIESKDVKISSLLGRGGFGVVHLGEYKGKKVAIKQLLNIDASNVWRFRFECFLMKNLRHPNIVTLVGVVWEPDMLACVLEYVPNGCLDDHLLKDWKLLKKDKMTWKDHLLRVALQTAMGVQYLHHSRYFDEKEDTWRDCVIHRDLKPDNILVTHDFTAKLTDFGEARAADPNLKMTVVGTPIYMAPEILKNDFYDFKCDVYSFGVCLAALTRSHENIIVSLAPLTQPHPSLALFCQPTTC